MHTALAATLFVTLLAFTGIWLIHVRFRDAGYVDYYWGPGFAVIALISGWMNGYTIASAVLTGTVIIWALRLSAYLIARHRKSTLEDARYAAMRATGGREFWWKSLFSIFLLQGFLQWVIAAPLHMVSTSSHVGDWSSPLFIGGLLVIAFGLSVEWIADLQLSRHRESSSAPGRLMTLGLWSISRHPNYLGEIILWSGMGLAAFSVTHSLIAFAGPVVLAIAMIGVSIPLTETHLRKSRPQYEAYAARTPKLVPRLAALHRSGK